MYVQLVGKGLNEALAQMSFSQQQRAYKSSRLALRRAALNADFYHSLSPSDLVVERAWTGKGMTSARARHHSKGRTGRSHWRTSSLTVRLREMRPEERTELNRFGKGTLLPTKERLAALDPRAY